MATELIPLAAVRMEDLAIAAQLASLADETPEGRSIVTLVGEKLKIAVPASHGGTFVPFTAQTRMSGIDLPGRSIRKGAVDAVAAYVRRAGRGGRRTSSSRSRTGSATAAARRWRSPTARACSGSFTSRTS